MKNYKFILFYVLCILTVGSVFIRSENNIINTKYVYASKEILDETQVDVNDNDNYADEEENKTEVVLDNTSTDSVEETNNEIDEKVVLEDNSNSEEIVDVYYGKLSRYGPDCYGCSGYLASGNYVGDGNIYYYDSYYGNVRILAGDKSYPFGTIVRVSYGSEVFLGIVLDRGGAIGFNKTALFDLLYPSEYLANIDGVSYNTKFEILRIGF